MVEIILFYLLVIAVALLCWVVLHYRKKNRQILVVSPSNDGKDNFNEINNRQSMKQFEIENDGTIICDNYKGNGIDENILLVPNIYNIIDTHISTRDKHRGQIVYTTFLDKHCQLLSNSQTDFMIDMLFETGDLKEQLELERFKGSRYYSFFANDSNCSYTLVLNSDKKIIAQVIVDIMINVYSHPKGKFLDCLTDIL